MRILLLVVTLSHILLSSHVTAADNIYIVRHAEKQKNQGKNPSLTEQGKERAQWLAQFFKHKSLTAIYSSEYKRTIETATPSAKVSQLNVQFYNPSLLDEFASQIKALEGNVLIVGHSNTINQTVVALGGETFNEVQYDEFSRLYHISYIDDKPSVKLLRSQPTEPH